ncbi:CHAT domain-containing protein [Rhizobium sp. PP-F2F-G38]|nr:CHAT domain-containing protein [Rhizobium sp. PP-F2F-G38]
MRLMYVAGNPEGARSLEAEQEITDLQERLERGVGADPIDFRVYSALTLGKLGDTVRRTAPDVLHISAHGEDDAVVLAEPGRKSVLLDGRTLATLLAGMPRPLRLIVINACSSSEMAATLANAGAADFVIGTDAPITNTGARSMAGALYQSLAGGASIADAFNVAAGHLVILDEGQVEARLYPEGAMERARGVRLVDPVRILACFPLIDKWIDAGLTKPDKGFKPEHPDVLFGVAGMPAATRQTVLFTDDDTVKGCEGEGKDRISIEEARSWIVNTQPDHGEVWMPDSYPYWGNMNWYVAVTTTDGRLASASSTLVNALSRYYFEERFRNAPPAIADVIRASITHLASRSGSRRRTIGSRRAIP